MNYEQRLNIALFENVLLEMPHLSLPVPVPIPDREGNIIHVKYLDMQWELYGGQLKNWGYSTPFIAELPVMRGYTRQYIVWDGGRAYITQQYERAFEQIPSLQVAPSKWWEMADGVDESGENSLASTGASPAVRTPA